MNAAIILALSVFALVVLSLATPAVAAMLAVAGCPLVLSHSIYSMVREIRQ